MTNACIKGEAGPSFSSGRAEWLNCKRCSAEDVFYEGMRWNGRKKEGVCGGGRRGSMGDCGEGCNLVKWVGVPVTSVLVIDGISSKPQSTHRPSLSCTHQRVADLTFSLTLTLALSRSLYPPWLPPFITYLLTHTHTHAQSHTLIFFITLLLASVGLLNPEYYFLLHIASCMAGTGSDIILIALL